MGLWGLGFCPRTKNHGQNGQDVPGQTADGQNSDSKESQSQHSYPGNKSFLFLFLQSQKFGFH